MKTDLLSVTRRRFGCFIVPVAAALALLFGGCVAPYDYGHAPRYRPYGYYGYHGIPSHGYYGGFYQYPYWRGGFGGSFGGLHGFYGGHHGGGRH